MQAYVCVRRFAFQFQTAKQENAPGGTVTAADANNVYLSFDNLSASVPSRNSAHAVIMAIGLDSGDAVWQRAFNGSSLSNNMFLLNDKTVVTSYATPNDQPIPISSSSNHIIGLDPATGQTKWDVIAYVLRRAFCWMMPSEIVVCSSSHILPTKH